MVSLLKIAEVVDAFRLIPRIVLGMYAYGIFAVGAWYMSFEDIPVRRCDSNTLSVLLEKQVELKIATNIACPVTEIISHPNGYIVLFNMLLGVSAVVVGLYVNSGRRWGNGNVTVQTSSKRLRDESDYLS